MGYKTPNIDSIAKEGVLFTDWYGQQSCTAGRAAFITGQSPIRTGLTKVGLPGAPEGLKKEDATIAELLKAQGYVTGQFGKNHLGDRDEMLPTLFNFNRRQSQNITEQYWVAIEVKGKEASNTVGDINSASFKHLGGIFLEEIDTQWEGGYRVPTVIKWPGVIKPGIVINDITSHEDMLPTLVAAAGDKTAKEDLKKGRKIGNMTYKVHLDGYDLGPALRGEAVWPRNEFIYWTDDGSVAALRYGNWKITFLKQNALGLKVWQEPFVALRAPMLANLRMDPSNEPKRKTHGLPALVPRPHVRDCTCRRLCRPMVTELP